MKLINKNIKKYCWNHYVMENACRKYREHKRFKCRVTVDDILNDNYVPCKLLHYHENCDECHFNWEFDSLKRQQEDECKECIFETNK